MTIARHALAAARPAPRARGSPEPGGPRLLSSGTRIPRTAAPQLRDPDPEDRGSPSRGFPDPGGPRLRSPGNTVDRSFLTLASPAGCGSQHFGDAAPPLR